MINLRKKSQNFFMEETVQQVILSESDAGKNGAVEENSAALEEPERLLPQPRELLDLSTQYQQFLFFYEAGAQQVTAKLQILSREFQCFYERNPIESIKSRIKSPESIIQKMKRKGLPLMVNCMLDNIYDIAGIRVVCPFVSDVYQVAQLLIRQPDIELIEQKDYIRQPKENGYRSLHLIVKVTIYFAEQRKEIPVEIQLRTIAMDFWASTEHQLRYKKNLNFTDEMQDKLLECARAMERADQQMQEIANIVMGI